MADKPPPNDPKESSENKNDDSAKPEEIIASKLKPILEDLQLPEEESKKILEAGVIIVKEARRYKGPLPPPEMLNDYNLIVSNGAERIVRMVEIQSQHRIDLERKIIPEQASQSRRGQTFGFILALISLGITTLLSMSGHEVVAGIIGGSTILGLVTVFAIGKQSG